MPSPDLAADNVLDLEGVHNFRDYGGYLARDGARLKTGLLWRSGQHQDATDADLDRIDALDLRVVVDLRGDVERQRFPCRRSAAFSATLLHSDGETAGSAQNAPHIQAAQSARTIEEAHARMVELNKSMPYRPNLVRTMSAYFEALATRDGASLVHCVAGKDRTGFSVAVLHHLLGVHQDDIMADFMLTNVAGNVDRRIAAGAATITHHFGDVPEEVIRTLMGVHPSYLETAFAAVAERYPSVEAYAEDVLGLRKEMREALIGRLLV